MISPAFSGFTPKCSLPASQLNEEREHHAVAISQMQQQLQVWTLHITALAFHDEFSRCGVLFAQEFIAEGDVARQFQVTVS